jgi:hypothetical protein
MRSMREIGALWPTCKSCNHIAQEHDDNDCGAVTSGQCPTCGNHVSQIKCQCKGYVGPTWEEIKAKLTPEEIAYYRY